MPTNRKYCPRCGALIHAGDAYCIRCGYSFGVRARGWRGGLNLRTIIFVIVILAIFWVGIRLIIKQPIIPTGITDFFRNITAAKTK